MEGGSVKAKDKYIVSFNSDTSDSEDDSEGEVVKAPPPKKPAPKVKQQQKKQQKSSETLMNGHVGLENGDLTNNINSKQTSLAKTEPKETKKIEVNGPSLGLDKSGKHKTDSGSRLTSKNDDKEVSLPKQSKGLEFSSTTRAKSSISDANDLESAYTRAKEKQSKLASKKTDEKPSLLIDLAEVNDSRDSSGGHNSKKETMHEKTSVMSPKYSADLEKEMSGYFNKGQTNGVKEENMDFRDYEIKKNVKEDGNEEFDIDADLLIYASSGTSANKPTKFDFDMDKKDTAIKRSYSVDDVSGDDKSFRRQNSKPDELESLLSPKEKYRNLDEKFSAICSKYGRENKRDAPQSKPEPVDDLEENMDIYGTVKVKTNSKQESTKPDSPKDDEDLGFSEERTPRQKLSFDDIISWKKGSTHDLIQRILSDARNESSAPTSGITKGREPRDEELFREKRYSSLEPYDRESDASRKYNDYGQASPSLLERRLAALGGERRQDDHDDPYARSRKLEGDDPYARPKPGYQEESDQFYKRKTRGSSVPVGIHLDDSDTISLDSASNYPRYVPWKERQAQRAGAGAGAVSAYDDEDDLSCGASARGYQSNLLCPPGRYDGDSDSDNESYKSTRPRSPVLPDECFKPQRHEETEIVVRERTSEVRNMVENQTEVLGRLKKASDSFNDLDAEIRQLKQQCIENQAARQAIIEDILTDMKDNTTLDDEPAPAPRRYTRGSYKSSDSYASKYSSPYLSSYSRSRESSRCRDMDSDRIVGGYALGSVARSRYGEPGGSRSFRSASVSRFDNVEKEHSYDKYGLYNPNPNPKRSARAGSYVDDSDNKSDYNVDIADDRSDCGSVRSYKSEKTADDGANEDSGSSYRSRYSTPKYGTHLTPSVPEPRSYSRYSTPTRETSYSREPSYAREPSYTSSSREPRSSVRRSADVSYDRPRTRGMSLPPPEKPFQSRFLSKVREKKASGVDISTPRDKPFKSRFLTRSFDSDYHSGSGSSSRGSLASTPDRNTSRSYSSRKRDTDTSETTAD